jgi:hypothetical protein
MFNILTVLAMLTLLPCFLLTFAAWFFISWLISFYLFFVWLKGVDYIVIHRGVE